MKKHRSHIKKQLPINKYKKKVKVIGGIIEDNIIITLKESSVASCGGQVKQKQNKKNGVFPFHQALHILFQFMEKEVARRT